MRKKITTAFLFGLFSISLLMLGVHIFPEVFGRIGEQPPVRTTGILGRYEKTAEVPLGKVEVRGYQQMGSTPGVVRISPAGDRVLTGTETGEILFLDVTGKRLWRRQVGLGKISALEFSRDGSRIYVGENSQQGALSCLEAATGKEIWRKSSVDELGVDIRQKTFPGIMSMTTDAMDNVYAVALRSIRHSDGWTEYFSRIYRIDPSGRVELLPRDHNIDVWVSCVSVDESGSIAVFGTSDYAPGPTRRYQSNIYALDTATGRELWHQDLPTVPPYERTNMRFGPEISADGTAVAGIASDGRAFFFRREGQWRWTRSLSHPQKIQNVYLNATGLHVRHLGDYVAFTTGNTYNRANWQLPTPVEHPQSNSVFLFDREGVLVKRRKMGGMLEQMAPTRQALAVGIGRNIRTKDPGAHGLYLLSIPELELTESLPTDGPCVAIAASRDARILVAMEAPLQLDNGEVIGDYRLHIWQAK